MLTVYLVRTGEICFLIRNAMTKLLATTTLLLTLLVSPLMAEVRKGYFDCRITQSYAVDFIDGVSKEYFGGNSKYGPDFGPNVGASVKVNYSYNPSADPLIMLVNSFFTRAFWFFYSIV